MSCRSSALRALARASVACMLATAVVAATPEAEPTDDPEIEELDEVFVTARSQLPLEDFVEFPKYDSVVLSPNGKQLAMGWTDVNFRRSVNVLEFPSMKGLFNYSLSAQISVQNLGWASDRKLVVEPNYPVRGFHRRREALGLLMINDANGGNQHYINREALASAEPLAMRRRDEEAAIAAAPEEAVRAGRSDRSAIGAVRMVTTRLGEPEMVMFQTMQANGRSGGTDGYGVFLLNLKDNRQTRVASMPVAGAQIVLGPDFRVAVATGVSADHEEVAYYLPPDARAEGTDWKLIVRSQPGQRGLRPVGWTGKGEEYFALDGRSARNRGVVIWNAQDNSTRLLYRHPEADMDNVALDPQGRPWMFSGSDHFPVYWYPDNGHKLAALHRMLVKKVPGEQIDVINASDDLNYAVVRISSGRRPPLYLVLDVRTGNSAAGLHTYPTLRGHRLAQVDPIEFRSRDGLVVRGYLTTPEDTRGQARRGLPLIVVAHDGPLSDPAQYQYEFERQLFASRGYAVLQVNRRGSTGRGLMYERAGDGKWGREVQDDFIDGVRWAIKDGVADPERVCFYGTGYGAYSAMTAAAREPELFKCVIGVGGVYDLPRMLGEGKGTIPAAMRQVLGSDMEDLKARSPVSLASAVKAKVLLMPHERDEYVPNEQSIQMRNALREAGNAAQWEILGQQYDGIHTPSTRSGGYVRILRFLEGRIGK